MAEPHPTSKGVDALIARLRDDGVSAGREEADRIRSEAEAEAAHILANAKQEAEAHLREARKSADRYRSAGEEALNTAMRDAMLTLKAGLMVQFESDVRRMVTAATADPEMLNRMVLELVGAARDATGAGEDTDVILPAEVIGPEAISDNPEEIRSGQLTQFVLGLAQEMLAKGVTLYATEDLEGGIRARVVGKDLELDLSDEAIAALLMQHLQPRFRAVLDGVIKK